MLIGKTMNFYFIVLQFITNALVVYINTMALSNKPHVPKQGHYKWRRVQYILYIEHVELIMVL